MKLEIDGKQYKLWFEHDMTEQGVLTLDTNECDDVLCNSLAVKATTSCFIFETDAEGKRGNLAWEGHAFCSPRDQFRKATGRKIALSRAIDSLERSSRTQVWEQYLLRVNV